MPLVYRSEKGAPLTAQEIDGNFKELNKRLKRIEDHPEAGEGIGKINVQNDQVTFIGTFGSELGTFPLPKTPSSSPPLYEQSTLPSQANRGDLAIILEKDGLTLIFFNGKTWQRLAKGETL